MRTIVKSECSKVPRIPVGIVGTDKEIFGADLSLRVKTRGRPKVNRELAYKFIKAGYSTRYICRVLKCKARTVRLMRKELERLGELEPTQEIDLDKIELEFDDECVRAVSISFYEWLRSKNIKNYKYIFNFCRRVWEKVWDKPSLVMVREFNNPLGDQLCMKFLDTFGEDKKRIRNRKLTIRFLFRFLGRTDLCDRYLTVSESRDPRPMREIPEISLTEFPEKLDKAIDIVGERLGDEYALALKFKIVTQMRTGGEDRELLGMKVGAPNGSWILMKSVDEWRAEVKAKKNEKWILTWIPRSIREELYRLYQQRERGEHLFKIKVAMLRRGFKEACKEVGLPPLRLHDLRKVAITWLWAMGVPLEFATEINVGWKDLNTAKRFYLQMRKLLRRSQRELYREKIPEWFKEGLDEYLFF